jgi:formylmethanofuran dehydrogenase subunit A
MTYMSEIAISQVRGALLSSFALSFGLGQLLNAVGFQILAEASQNNLSTSHADETLDCSPKVPERNLLSVHNAWFIRYRHFGYS